MALLNFIKKLRSKKNIMVDGETELDSKKAKSIPMFLNADEISPKPGQKMADIARDYKPEKVHAREVKKSEGLTIGRKV